MASKRTETAPKGRWEPPASREAVVRETASRSESRPASSRDEERAGWFGALLIAALLAMLFNSSLAMTAAPTPDLAGILGAFVPAPGVALFAVLFAVALTGWRALAWTGAILLTVLALLVALDVAYAALYGRSVDIVTDMAVLSGRVEAMLASFSTEDGMMLAGVVLALVVVFLLASWMLRALMTVRRRAGLPVALLLVAVLAGAGAALSIQSGGPPWQARALETALGHVADLNAREPLPAAATE